MKNIISFFYGYASDSRLRRNVGMLIGIFINSFYIVVNLIWGIKHRNVWFISVAAYYMLIALFRYLSIDVKAAEAEIMEVPRALMLVLSVPMTGMISYTVITSNAHGYPKSSLPVFAAYAVFSIFRAIYGLAFSKKEDTGSARTTHVIRLSLALMSLFNLQTSLFAFLGFDSKLSVFFNFITGGAVSISMLALAKLKI